MEKVRILGIVGSPRKKGNTAKLVKEALEAISSFPWVETELFEVAGKKINHCLSCYKCMEKLQCIQKDGLYEFCEKFMAADGIIWGVPVYHMSVPSVVKALLDRFGNMMLWRYLAQGKDVPRFSKVCGVLTNGASRYGGQDLTLSFLVNSSLLMNGVVVAGDTIRGDSYIGAAAWTGQGPNPLAMDNVLQDERGIACARSVARRVAEMARIVKAGKAALGSDLPSDYSYTWDVEYEPSRTGRLRKEERSG
jgi:multimeric flavodoxin WrbA